MRTFLGVGAVAIAAMLVGCGSDAGGVFQQTGSGGNVASGGGSAAGGSGQGASASGGSSSNGGSNAGGAQAGGSSAGGANVGGSSAGGANVGGSGGQGGAPGGQGAPCTWGQMTCDQGLYCQSTSCGAGTCQPPLPNASQTQIYDPVCGCDGVTYFNPTIAEVNSMSSSHGGPCTGNEAVPCTKQGGCPAPAFCSVEVTNAAACFLGGNMPMGTCWATPVSCDPNGPTARGCLPPPLCSNICSLIQGQNAWYQDPFCP